MTKTPATARKQAQRQRDKAAGINEIRVRLEQEEFAMLTEGMAARRLFRPAYDLPEYIALLIRQDNQRLEQQFAELSQESCERCGDKAPGDPTGCCLRGEAACWQTKGINRLLINVI
ncbi:hypothetical protein [Yersinia ruckeri]|uniref:hypothetical protein n=1 Tax=Yersinia ruckeri TaxID=29486 RepID=UPI002238DC72|nr:hypothetical protein [Yersinia ruckeri]MCW6548617.1 hypothetical protein [Yersinia ruckeri]MCW6553700.1 hypothetical protein [Yersinia ruckeri]MCW6557044.1 hypothetical protein [Yersinia ruckeri]MCW6582045.1 hypothetical protein [Yersinia ruckeri]MCW6595828.1 hypothetical protein [Yersinia ruckeri]